MARWGHLAAALTALAVVAGPRPASATVDLLDDDTYSLTLSGYLRSLTGVQHLPLQLDVGGTQTEDDIGLHSDVLRVEWSSDLGEMVTIDVHQRLFWSVQSTSTFGAGGAVGAGVSQAPPRTVDLSTDIFDDPTLQMNHDIDRAVVRLYLDAADIWVGRQAITWGISTLFPVADLWTVFSPFELDTDQKRGIDAARVITSVSNRVELDFIVADRGELEDTSAGVRANVFLDRADAYVATAKHWNSLMLFAGYSHFFDQWSVRLELAQPFDLDDGFAPDLPRATIGADYIANRFFLSMELHHNGAGTDDTDDYLSHVGESEEIARGEVYLWGRYYAGVTASYSLFDDQVMLSGAVLGNLLDPAVIVSPAISYRLSDEVEVSLGSYNGFGAAPETTTVDVGGVTFETVSGLGSEFGTYGGFYYLQVAAYY